MATSTFDVANSAVTLIGTWTYSTNTGGTAAYYIGAIGPTINFVANGTDCTLRVYATTVSDHFMVTVDGTGVDTTSGGTGWVDLPIFSGLSDAGHSVSVYRISGGTNFIIKSIAGISVTGATPSLSKTTDYTTYLDINTSAYNTHGAVDSGILALSASINSYNFSGGGGIRFYAAATDIWVMAYGAAATMALLTDNVETDFMATEGSTKWKLYRFSGLDGNSHEYRVVNKGMTTLFLTGIMVTGTGFIQTVVPTKIAIAWYGDSIVAEIALASAYDGAVWKLAELTNTIGIRRGYSSQRVHTYLRDNTANIPILPNPPKYVIVEGGVNDQAGSVTIGADYTTANSFTNSFYTMLGNVAARMASGGRILVQGILPNITTNYANRLTYVAAQSAAVAAYNATSPAIPATFYSTDGWIIPTTGVDLDDTVHPNAAGYSKIAAQWEPILGSFADLDIEPPVISSFVLPAAALSLTVNITELVATDNIGVTGYLINGSPDVPELADAGWVTELPTTVTAVEGSNTFYAWARDAAGNISDSATDSVVVTIPDTTPPEITAFTLPATADSATLTIDSLTATDAVGVTGYYLSESNVAPAVDAVGWVATAPTTFELTPVQTRTVYAWAKDAAGNISDPVAASVDVTLTGGGAVMLAYHNGAWIPVSTLAIYKYIGSDFIIGAALLA